MCIRDRDKPAASAVTVALRRKALRWARICAPRAWSRAVLASLMGGGLEGIVFLIIFIEEYLSIMRNKIVQVFVRWAFWNEIGL